MLTDEDFIPGKIVLNDFTFIDRIKTLKEQLDYLTEDMIQVEFDNNIVLDIGWYPEFTRRAGF